MFHNNGLVRKVKIILDSYKDQKVRSIIYEFIEEVSFSKFLS